MRLPEAGAATEARIAAPRNARFRFEYCVHSGKAIRLRGRDGSAAAVDWVLPADRPGEWRGADVVVFEGCAFLRIDAVLLVRSGQFPDVAGEGAFVLAVEDAEVSFRGASLQALSASPDADVPAFPWGDPRPGAGRAVRPPTPEGWTELFDQRSLANFVKRDRVSVSAGEGAIVVEGGDLLTSKSWKSVEIEIDFSLDGPGQLSTGLRGSWFAKDEVPAGAHRLQMRVAGDRAEAVVDGRTLAAIPWSPSASGTAKIRVEGTTARVTSVRWRGIAEPETQPEKPPDRPPGVGENPQPDKPPPHKPPPNKPPPNKPPGPGPKPR
ncbi:MAG: hypothetical protein HUU15_11675 [Candidatus Brocadiae bacterium]|nr:hypothetical protein [Candidatus Brocadiia bacterium]